MLVLLLLLMIAFTMTVNDMDALKPVHPASSNGISAFAANIMACLWPACSQGAAQRHVPSARKAIAAAFAGTWHLEVQLTALGLQLL